MTSRACHPAELRTPRPRWRQSRGDSNWRSSAEQSLPPPRRCYEFRGLDIKRIRDPPEHSDCHRRLRSLNLADITRAQLHSIGKVLLRPTSFVAESADIDCNDLL
jgi:hypothetical protein